MFIPSSTYRIQLHKDFAFKELHRILEYLHTLGVTTVYASPILQATPGSMHGYDVTDPHVINPELGTAEDLRSIVRDLHKKDMTWIQDIVPNHMAFNPMNRRLMDVLERGPESPYYMYFDINWNHPDTDLYGKVMVPFLGNEPEACIKNGEIQLELTGDGFFIKYFETPYPFSLSAYGKLIQVIEKKNQKTPLALALQSLPDSAMGLTLSNWQSKKKEIIDRIISNSKYVGILKQAIDDINNDHVLLSEFLNEMYYRLSFWKETDRRINYRRFFTVNELICLRMEDEEVFEEYHTYLLKLFKEKLIQGFRIDHIDGLQDPAVYTQRLRKSVGDNTYIIAEKILEAKENMPTHWPLQGTSGYEFLSFLNQLLTQRKGARQMLNFYQELLPDIPPYRKLIFDSKKLILENYISGEWDNLTQMIINCKLTGGHNVDRLRQALGFFMLSLPVYRIYPDKLPLKGNNLIVLYEAFEKAFTSGKEYQQELLYLRRLFTETQANEKSHNNALSLLKRIMQFTGPLTAKGVEDTTFYIYNPLISHDEVGDSPFSLGMSVQRFHDKMKERQRDTPFSLNASATHDTKRGEDARIRINVLSRMPDSWKEHVADWFEINTKFRIRVDGRAVPALNDEYFIYQSMLGGFPEDLKVTDEWIKRVQAYLNKALREAKVNTNWTEPDEQYEKACEAFIEKILSPDHGFIKSFVPFLRTVIEQAMVYSLSQTLIKLTAPGIPDVYQGCELWDLSFVDPDNRRPVDYDKRMGFLFQLNIRREKGKDAILSYLKENRESGIEKLFLTWKVLNFRRDNPTLFTEGEYIPLTISGRETGAAGYARHRGGLWVLVLFPLGLVKHDRDSVEEVDDQFLLLPEICPEEWVNLFTGETVIIPNQISINDLFHDFPVAMLTADASFV